MQIKMNLSWYRFRFIIIWYAVILLGNPTWSKNDLFIFTFDNLKENHLIGTSTSIFKSDDQFDLSAKMYRDANLWKPNTTSTINLGFINSRAYIKLDIYNNTQSDKLRIFIQSTQIDTVELYQVLADSVIFIGLKGAKVKQEKFDVDFIIPHFDIYLNQGDTSSFLFAVNSKEQIILPIYVGSIQQAGSVFQRSHLFFGLYTGIMLVMFFYNLFLFIIVKDKSYLFYVLYILSIGIAQGAIAGYTKAFFWPNDPNIQNFSIVLFSCLTGFSAIAFAQQFLNLKHTAPHINNVLKLFYVVYLFVLIFFLMGWYQVTYSLMNLGGLLVCSYAIIFGAYLSWKGVREARFYLIAWLFFLSGIITFVLMNVGLLPFNFLTNHSIQIGSAIEAVLLSIALADRINILKKEKEKSQADALIASLENERMIKEQNIILEQKVKERTAALENTNQELHIAFKDLKEAQTQLVESEKMASLGQLTAGVAHEINNPINFVSSNIKPLQRDISDIISIIEKYDEISLDEQKLIVDQLKSELDFDYLKEEVNMLLKGIQEGASRTVEIVQSLRNFSRLDEHDLKKANILDGLDSTLVLLNSSMGGIIHVIKKYSDIPEIDCYPGKLNQVFMNILSNSIYAIQSKFNYKPGGELYIGVSHDNNHVHVIIRDNGTGMPKEVVHKIFEPFYTSKPVGEGTGLGLSIVYKIIENHKGTIKVDSEEGKWTEFSIMLPKIA
jgi:signal transduction histidine kinase